MPTLRDQIELIKTIPKSADAWYLAIRKLHTWLELDDGTTALPYIMLLIHLDRETIISLEILPSSPKPEQIILFIQNAILNPSEKSLSQPIRPEMILCEEPGIASGLSAALDIIDINVQAKISLPHITKIINEIEDMLGEHEPVLPGLLNVSGATPESISRLFSTAADFYREDPWKYLSDAQPLHVHFHNLHKDAYIQLMGHAGIEYGIVLYWSWNDLIHTYVTADDPIEQVPPGGWRSLTFENSDMLPWEDLNAIEKYNWEIADKSAYPLIMIYTRTTVERPTNEELSIFEALLKSIPGFVNSSLQAKIDGDYYPVQSLHQVQVADEIFTITISYPAGELPDELFIENDDNNDFSETNIDPSEQIESTSRLLELKDIKDYRSKDISVGKPAKNYAPDRCRQLIQLAWQESELSERIRLANQALSINENCIDAYVLLAEDQADSIEEAYEYYLAGTKAGENTIGITQIQKNDQRIQDHPEFIPYLRARRGLAECLVFQSDIPEAMEHCKAILTLNPDDDLGIRYLHLSLLIRTSNDQDAWKLLDNFENDNSTDWIFSRALLTYRREGSSDNANKLLKTTLQFNPFASNYLLGRAPLPDESLPFIRPGDESEAVDYVRDHFTNWYGTKGAIEWLKTMIETLRQRE